LNIVTGFGNEVGAALVEHKDIAKITFTGSDVTGARIYETAARGMKRVAMELGGKSPNIVFEDADLEAAAVGVVSGIFGAAGQMCIAGSRLLVQNSIKDSFTERLVALARDVRLGDPMQPTTNVGPITTPAQYAKVLDYIEVARRDGARCILGGKPAVGPGLTGGQFVEPTLHWSDQRHAHCAGGSLWPRTRLTASTPLPDVKASCRRPLRLAHARG
jgi:aldehyde dehydrogenase (NAD+)